MTFARDLASFADSALQNLSFRNLIINGTMQFAQRATSVASITTSDYRTVDRFTFNMTTMGTWTMSQENDAPTGSGFRRSLKVLCTTADASPAAGDDLWIGQRFEGQNLQQICKGTSSAKQLTLSFWVKSNKTGTYIVELVDQDSAFRTVSKSYTVDVSGTWEYKTVTFPADTTGAFDNDNALSMYVQWWLGAGTNYTSGTLQTTWAGLTQANRAVGQTNLAANTNNYWQMTGVQLEVGPAPTPFEFRPYPVELAMCQRYYEKSYNIETAVGTNTGTGATRLTIAQNSIYARATIFFKVPKRAAPTMTFWLGDGTSNQWNWDQIGVGSENDTITGNTPETHSVIFETNGISSTRNNATGHWAAAIEL
jgi:hypothetical protein